MLNQLHQTQLINNQFSTKAIINNCLLIEHQKVLLDLAMNTSEEEWHLYFYKFYTEKVFKDFGITNLKIAKEQFDFQVNYDKEKVQCDLSYTFWINFFTDLMTMENIQQAVKSIAPTLKKIVIKKLFLHRYSWHQNAINHNLMSQDTSLCFIYWIQTCDSNDEIWFPDINEFFKVESNMLIFCEVNDFNNYLTNTQNKNFDFGFYITGFI